MKVLVTGASGLIGSALCPALTAHGHHLLRLTRAHPPADASTVRWDPAAGHLDPKPLEGVDGVVHLAGESLATGRWTAAKKDRIRSSRVAGTRLLAETLARLLHPPPVLVCTSAVGYYGHRGDAILREDDPPGSGFLAEVCQAWEAAAEPARQRGIRVVHLRLGVVLSPAGGALASLLVPFRMGLGGRLGHGDQYLSWIAMDDVVDIIQHALATPALQGPVNAVTPEPVTNRVFTRTLGRVLRRPTLFPLPAFAARLLLGEMADELLLSSARVEPARLRATRYTFRYPGLEGALRHLLAR